MTKLRRRVGPLLAAVLLAAASACEEATAPEPEPGFVGIWGGSTWTANAVALISSRGGVDSLHLMGSAPPGSRSIVSSYVRISVPLRGTGEYVLGRGDAAMTHLVGGDVVSAFYPTTRANAGTLTIREYRDGWVEGSVSFDAEASATAAGRPVGAAARFEGSFRAPIRLEP